MFNIGDLIIYSTHGICQVDDICEETYFGVAKDYYLLHPIEDSKLKISTPVDNDKVIMLQLLTKEEAEEILESFKLPGIDWIQMDNDRNAAYSSIVKKGNRREIASIANTLMREKIKIERQGRKFHEKDMRILSSIQKLLFSELAVALNTTYEVINAKAHRFIKETEY